MASQTRLPIVLDVPFAATIVGFRPNRLPPLFECFRGIRIAHVQSNHWADRAGLKVGDIITHVNGKAVTDMARADEFTDAMKERPLRITIDIPVSADELSDVIGKYDWSARMDTVKKAQQAKELVDGETNEVYETVFKPAISKEDKSPLFDATKWLNARPPRSGPLQNDHADDPPLPVPTQRTLPEPTVTIVQKVEPPKLTAKPKPKPKPKGKPTPFQTSRKLSSIVTSKWVPNRPLTVMVRVDSGTDIPVKAGTLGLDFLAQPFNSDPYLELSLCAAPGLAEDMTLDAILTAAPLNDQKVDTPVCDPQMRWNFSHTFKLPDPMKGPEDTLLIGKLYDYRRIAAAKLMGVFAIKLSAVDVSDTVTNGKQRLISLTSADPFLFDVKNTKIKMTMVLEGKFSQITEEPKDIDEVVTIESGISTPQDAGEAEETNEAQSQSGGDDNEEMNGQGNRNAPPPYIPPAEPLKLVYNSPFERALQHARDQIRLGDYSPLRSQKYSIR